MLRIVNFKKYWYWLVGPQPRKPIPFYFMDITHDLVKQIFNYHQDGYLTWKIKICAKVKIGSIVGTLGNKNRYRVTVYGKRYLRSRLIFFYHTGFWVEEVDHINNISTDDRIENLRSATRTENMKNTSSRKNSSSKYLGVYWSKRRKIYIAQIALGKGKKKQLLSSHKEEKAALAYNKAAVKYHGEFANLNIIVPLMPQNNS